MPKIQSQVIQCNLPKIIDVSQDNAINEAPRINKLYDIRTLHNLKKPGYVPERNVYDCCHRTDTQSNKQNDSDLWE